MNKIAQVRNRINVHSTKKTLMLLKEYALNLKISFESHGARVVIDQFASIYIGLSYWWQEAINTKVYKIVIFSQFWICIFSSLQQ